VTLSSMINRAFREETHLSLRWHSQSRSFNHKALSLMVWDKTLKMMKQRMTKKLLIPVL
jgi:hypothetical protein